MAGRGPAPIDQQLFAADQLPALRSAASDLGWLLGRGYAPTASLKLVGDRHRLHSRQRKALMRGTCAPEVARRRRLQRRPVAGAAVAVDGFNVIVSVETAMAGGLLVRGVDGLLRDLAGMHGKYRDVAHTRAAVQAIAAVLGAAASVQWVLDRPVSHSGRLASLIRGVGFSDVILTDLADRTLAQSGALVASADGPLLDRSAGGVDVVSAVVEGLDAPWVVSLEPELVADLG